LAKLDIRYLLEKPLAGGNTAYYYNPPRAAKAAGILEACALGTDKGAAVGKAENYNRVYDEWKAGDKATPRLLPGSISWLIAQYKESSWYAKLKPKTKKGYDADLKRIENFKLKSGKTLGIYMACAVTSSIADSIYEALKPAGLRTANGVMVMAQRLWNYGKRYHAGEHGIDHNPFLGMGLTRVDARSQQWTMKQVETFVTTADDNGAASIGTAALICYMFNQRTTTAITAPWTAWDGNALLIRQSKRGRLVWVPALPELRERLNTLKGSRGDAIQIVIDERTGRAYDEYSFSHRGLEMRKLANIPPDLQIRDLRRTGTTETRAAGANDHELQATTGNNPESLQIYSVPSNAEAASAMRKRQRYRTKMKQKSE
jgi:hypothetical protein